MKKVRNSIICFVAFFFIAIVAFLFGIHWHGTLSSWVYWGKLKVNKLTCFGHNNINETYQQDCYFPAPKSLFVMKSKLSCQLITNHQLGLYDYYSKFASVISIKTDYHAFTLNIHENDKTLFRSRDPGEVARGRYNIIQNDNKSIMALRKQNISLGRKQHIDIYEYITLSKQTGAGSASGYNFSNTIGKSGGIATEFFLCR